MHLLTLAAVLLTFNCSAQVDSLKISDHAAKVSMADTVFNYKPQNVLFTYTSKGEWLFNKSFMPIIANSLGKQGYLITKKKVK